MTRRYILILLSTLSLSAVFNFIIAWQPQNHATPVDSLLPSVTTQAIALPTSGALKKLASRESSQSVSKLTMLAQNTKNSLSPLTPTIITSAEAATFPLTPTEKISPEEIGVLGNLRSIKEKIDARSKALDIRQQAIEKAEADLRKKVEKLEVLLAQTQDVLQQQKKVKNKKIKLLANVYNSMKPDKAAPVISKMEVSTVIKMFVQMDEKKVGKILSFLPPEKAVQISQRLVRLRAGS